MMMVGALLALSCPRGWAAAKAPTVLTYSETYADKVVCTGSNSQGDLDCEPYSEGKFTIKAVITTNDFGAAIDPSQFDQDDTFDISLGEYSFSTNGWYVPGSTKAKFLLSGDLCSANDVNNGLDCPQKVYETITLSWTTKAVTVSISAKTETDANGNTFEYAIDADTFEPEDATGTYYDTITFQMDLGSLSVSSTNVQVVAKEKGTTDKAGDPMSNGKDSRTILASDLVASDLGQNDIHKGGQSHRSRSDRIKPNQTKLNRG
jgi:hypothetical protein